jgi:hypothetical protein
MSIRNDTDASLASAYQFDELRRHCTRQPTLNLPKGEQALARGRLIAAVVLRKTADAARGPINFMTFQFDRAAVLNSGLKDQLR